MNTTSTEENKSHQKYCVGCSRVVRDGEVTIHASTCQTPDAIKQRTLPRPPLPGSMVDCAGADRTVNNIVRHEYRVLGDAEKELMKLIKDSGAELIARIRLLPPGRESSLAITKAEECVMWAVKGLTG